MKLRIYGHYHYYDVKDLPELNTQYPDVEIFYAFHPRQEGSTPRYYHSGLIDAFSVAVHQVEATVATFDIEVRQTGWQCLEGNRPKYVSVWYQPDDNDIESCIRYAFGYISEVPGDLFTPIQTIRFACAPEDIDKRLVQFAKRKLDIGAPFIDFQLEGADPEDPESYLAARSDVYLVGAGDHVISVVDEIVGDRVVDLSGVDLYDQVTSSEGAYERSTNTLTARVDVEWTQAAAGRTNIAGQLPGMTSLDPSIAGSISSRLLMKNAEGWTISGDVSVKAYSVNSVSVPALASTYLATMSGRRELVAFGEVHNGADGIYGTNPTAILAVTDAGSDGQPIEQNLPVVLTPHLQVYEYDIERLMLTYDYQQARSETAYVAFGAPIARSMVLGTTNTEIAYRYKDIFVDYRYNEWEEGSYDEGDIVRRLDLYYICLQGHYGVYFDQVRVGTTNGSYWKRFYPTGLLKPNVLTSFFNTTRGEQAAQHIARRLRKEILRRARARHVTCVYRWEDAAHVTMRDSVKILIHWGDGTLRSVTGKVVGIESKWDGVSQPTISIEFAVCFGVGQEPDLYQLYPDFDERFGAESYYETGVVEYGYDQGSYYGQDMDLIRTDPQGFRPAPTVPVDAFSLQSGSFAVRSADVINDANEQVSHLSEFTSAGTVPRGMDPTQFTDFRNVSVVYGTAIDIRMQDIVPTVNPLHLEHHFGGGLFFCPQGVDLGQQTGLGT